MSNDSTIINAPSTIREITVYPDSAVIKRAAEVKLDVGQYTIRFGDLIPQLNEDTLRVSANGEGAVKIAGAQLKREYLPVQASERIQKLYEQLQNLQDEKQRLEDELMVRAKEKEFLESLKTFSSVQLPKEIITKMANAVELTETFQFYSRKLTDNFSSTLETRIKLRDLTANIQAIQQEYNEISSYTTKEVKNIDVLVEVTSSGTYEINVSFQVWGACWRSSYDARTDYNAAQIELISYGLVTQTTGEDWEEVEMYLSTAKPATGGRMPEISPWILRPYCQTPVYKMAKRASVPPPPAPAAMPTPYSAGVTSKSLDENLILEQEEAAPQESYSQSEVKGTSVIYKLPRKVTVKSDGSEHKLPLSPQILAAEFEYSTYPMAVLSAFLRSQVKNSPDLQLLAGVVNIFLDGDYTGSSSIDNIGPGEEFDLYLGVDDNVKVKRDLVEKKTNEKMLGGNQQVTYKFKLTIENYKAKKIAVKLFEAIPVSEDAKIKVKFGQVSEEPKEKDWHDKKGIWLWELELEPKAKKEIVLNYTVEYPRDMQVEGLNG